MQTLFSTIPKLAHILSGNSAVRCFVITVKLWFFVLTRKFFGTNHDFFVTFMYKNIAMRIALKHPMDIAVLREIYIEKEYEWFPIEDPKVIIDLGAHFGDTALYYHCCFPDATIIAVEPAPESFKRLVENTKNIPQIKSVQAAVGETDGEIDLHIMPSSLGNSIMVRDAQIGTTKVIALSLASLMKKFELSHVDLLKFDIEGAEFSALSNSAVTSQVAALVGEVHEDLGGNTIQTFVDYFPRRTIQTEQLFNKKRFIVKIL